MLFSSTTFLYLFFPVVLFFYYVPLRRSRPLQNVFLLLASLMFYAWGEPRFVFVMMFSITVNYIFGLLAGRRRDTGAGRAILALSVAFNLSILFVFKYLGFAMTTANAVFGLSISVPRIALPIGISFFTFQAMSYVFDVYRGRGEVQRSILNVGLYISFFPQLIAGPIVRYQSIAEEIRNRRETIEDFSEGFCRFIIGLAKKVLLANSFALAADRAFGLIANGQRISLALSWLGAICYTLQIFFDFSGYSDMAIGLGRMFGFHFLENFDYPYISRSITEFWRRWHISLGTWFRDYVYIPLGGSRAGRVKTFRNLFVVWLLTGIWHGANWTFIVWGLMYFLLLAFEKCTGLNKIQSRAAGFAMWLYTLFFVIIGWVIFRSDSLRCAAEYLGCMFGFSSSAIVDGLFMTEFRPVCVRLILGILFSAPVFSTLRKLAGDSAVWSVLSVVVLLALFGLSLMSIESSSYNPFIYFNF